MQKIINLLVVTALLLCTVACGKGGKNYTILGELPKTEYNGVTVYLMDAMGKDTLGSAVIKDGQFQIKGTLEKTQMAMLITPANNSGRFQSTIVLEPGKIHINMVNDSLYGTKMNNLFYKTFTCDTVVANLTGQMQVLLSQYYTASTPDEQKAIVMEYSRVDSLLNVHNANHYREVFENNKKNIIGAYALNGLVQYENMSFEKLDSIMNHSNTAISEFEPLRIARTNLFHVANTSEGKPYVDIAGIDFATGQPTKLSAMLDTSKVTLVDFWASWCGPCRKEISENLIRLYDKYNQQGLNIIGVDVWERDTADHRKAVQELGINYPQLIDMTKKSTEEYGVDGIPTILLLGKDGIILKRNLRGEELEAAVVEALGIEQ